MNLVQPNPFPAETCEAIRAEFPDYLDGAVSGVAMAAIGHGDQSRRQAILVVADDQSEPWLGDQVLRATAGRAENGNATGQRLQCDEAEGFRSA